MRQLTRYVEAASTMQYSNAQRALANLLPSLQWSRPIAFCTSILLQANAVSTFNILNQEGRKVAGVLLPAGSS